MESLVAGPSTHRVLPDGCIDILFVVAGGRTGEGYVVGMMTRPLLVARAGASSTVAVRFKPGGAAAFFREPLHRLTDARVELPELWPRSGPLHERVAAAAGEAERIEVLVAELRRRLEGARRRGHAGCKLAIRQLALRPETGVQELCAQLGVSRQGLAKSFREHVGIPPKTLARVLRLQRALSLLAGPDPGRPWRWSDLALAAGFYDQSHMVAEWQDLVGLTPSGFLAESRGRFPFFQDSDSTPE